MRRLLTALLVGICGSLTGCGSMDTLSVMPDITAASEAVRGANVCKPVTGMDALITVSPTEHSLTADEKNLVAATPFSLSSLSSRRAEVISGLPKELQDDRVALMVLNAVNKSAADAQFAIQTRDSRLSTALVADATQSPSPGSVDEWDMRAFGRKVRENMWASGYAYAARPASEPAELARLDSPTFGQYFVDYYSAYFNGSFVDRFGNKLAKPDRSPTVSDTEIAGMIEVFVELVADYVLRTPVWQDSKSQYYPGGYNTVPTALAANMIASPTKLLEPSSANDTSFSKSCGITALKAEAVLYLANSSGTKASALGGLVGSSFGGLNFGLGVLGKWSIGDNQTLQTVAKTVLDRGFNRAMEEASYRVLYWIPYTNGILLTDLLQKYLDTLSKPANQTQVEAYIASLRSR